MKKYYFNIILTLGTLFKIINKIFFNYNLAGKIGTASCVVGKILAPHVHKGGTRILTGVSNMDKDEASKKMTNVFDIAAGAIEGFGIVYDGLEKSGIMLGKSISNNTVILVRHK